jgi:hypothetical protein
MKHSIWFRRSGSSASHRSSKCLLQSRNWIRSKREPRPNKTLIGAKNPKILIEEKHRNQKHYLIIKPNTLSAAILNFSISVYLICLYIHVFIYFLYLSHTLGFSFAVAAAGSLNRYQHHKSTNILFDI